MEKVDLKEKTEGYLLWLLAIAIIITFSALIYSFYIRVLIWGIIVVLMIWIFIAFMLGITIIILNYFNIGPFHSTAPSDFALSDVKILGKNDAKNHDR